MATLSQFSEFQEDGNLASCEVDGKIRYSIPSEVDSAVTRLIPFVSELPNVNFHDELMSNVSAKYTAASPKELFLTVEETKWSKIKTAWFEHGALAALIVALENSYNYRFNTIDSVSHSLNKLFSTYFKRMNVEGNENTVLPEFCSCKNWKAGLFRSIKWHPHCNKFAVVTARDDVHIYSTRPTVTSVLKHRTQQFITCIAWRPLSASEIAVGCSRGIYVWNIEPNSIVTRPSITCASFLSKPGHTYISSISWNQQGNILVSASLCDRTMYVWDVSMEVAVPIQKYGGGIPCLINWSPTSEYIFASTTNILFRIWSSVSWTCENWFTGSSRVRCACWSPNGSVLLFATVDEPVIYAITVSSEFSIFVDQSVGDANAISVADLTRQELPTGDIIGGSIVDMTWDPTGKFLAVIFKESNLIPVFGTTVCVRPKVLQLTPRCLIRGRLNEIPNCIDFQKNNKMGANLTIVSYFKVRFCNSSTFWNELFTYKAYIMFWNRLGLLGVFSIFQFIHPIPQFLHNVRKTSTITGENE